MNVDLLIQKSITGTITNDEQETLRKILIEQPELRENLGIEHAMYKYRNITLKSKLKEAIPAQKKQKSEVKKTYSKEILFTIFAALLLAGLACWTYLNMNTSNPVINYAEEQLNAKRIAPVQLMDSGYNPDEDFATSIVSGFWENVAVEYSAENYEEVLRLIQTLEEPTSEQLLYTGLCHAYKSIPDYRAANKIMKSLQSTADNLVYDQALWYGALIDIKLDKTDDATAQLSTIIQNGLWKQKEAKELIDLINNNKQ